MARRKEGRQVFDATERRAVPFRASFDKICHHGLVVGGQTSQQVLVQARSRRMQLLQGDLPQGHSLELVSEHADQVLVVRRKQLLERARMAQEIDQQLHLLRIPTLKQAINSHGASPGVL
jgi:hypothetical protein